MLEIICGKAATLLCLWLAFLLLILYVTLVFLLRLPFCLRSRTEMFAGAGVMWSAGVTVL